MPYSGTSVDDVDGMAERDGLVGVDGGRLVCSCGGVGAGVTARADVPDARTRVLAAMPLTSDCTIRCARRIRGLRFCDGFARMLNLLGSTTIGHLW
ncbi:hypothetical protein AAW14_04445 [Streptomyces hygroscopicus]|nr:hypothetical protein [Streptomyces hygroscopicus]